MSSTEDLEDFTTCSICLNTMTKTVTTSCCHRYCEKCITEWVDRNSSCPCCKSHIKTDNLFLDPLYDSLIASILKDREEKAKKYFEDVCMSSVKEACGVNSTHNYDDKSIEGVLRKHLQKSLSEHGSYFQSIKSEFEMKKREYEQSIQEYQDELGRQDTCESDIKEQISKLEENVSFLEKDFHQCKVLVADAFDRHLTEHIPSLYILPVCVSVYIVDKDVRLPDIVLQPNNSLMVIQDILKSVMSEKGETITEFINNSIYIFSPVVKKRSQDEYHTILSEIEKGKEFKGVSKSFWLDKPVLSCQLKSVSEIVLKDCIKFESDQPTCYVQKHMEGASQTVDYYKCGDCGFSWICKCCKQYCHKGHNTSVHVLQHKPTWACCYCPKKKKCFLKQS